MRQGLDPAQVRTQVLIDGNWVDLGTVEKATLILKKKRNLHGQPAKLSIELQSIPDEVSEAVQKTKRLPLREPPRVIPTRR